jgi:hypothetical protein
MADESGTSGPSQEVSRGNREAHNRWLQALAIAAAVLAVYLLTSSGSNPFNQYVLLSDAFLHGRLDIRNPPDYLELARYRDGEACTGQEPGCKGFVIDPPSPAVLLMPFVAIWGTDLNQTYVSMLFGALAMGLFWVAARQMGWSPRFSGAMVLLLALGTNFWWASTDGGLWTFAHVSAVFFLMAALVEATGARRPWLVGLLVGAAGLARLPVFLSSPFFAYLIIEKDGRPWREMLRDRSVQAQLAGFAAAVAVMAGADLLYNFARYGTPLDKGYDHPQYADQPWFAKGRFDISYIPRHIEAIFYKQPELNEGEFPYFRPSSYGMALFFTTPAFLYAFNSYWDRRTLAAALTLGLTAVPLVLHGTTGWAQFGYRFSMDLFPMLAVLTAAGMRHELSGLKWMAIAASCFVCFWGVLYAGDTPLEDLLGHQWVVPGL